jgi:hypothetical protein
MISVSGISSPESGDLMTTPMSGLSLAILLVGMLILLSLDLAHLTTMRASSVRLGVAAGRTAAVPRETSAGRLVPRRDAGLK